MEGFFISDSTQIHPEKIRAYLAMNYRLGHVTQDIILAIGQRSERLVTLFAAHSVDFGAFLTVYNPRGAIQSDTPNERGHAELANPLRECGMSAIEASGSEDGTDWLTKKSWICAWPSAGPGH